MNLRRTRIVPAVAAAAVLCLVAGHARAESELADLIQKGRIGTARELIAEGADVNATQGDGTTPLHWAAYRLDHDLVRDLIAAGANPAVANEFGSTPLAEAVKAADLELVTMLLDAGANPESPNADGQTALMLAARGGELAIVKLLVEHGADVNAREIWRMQTALMWAADGRYPALVEFLLDNGADATARAAVNDWGAQITSEPRAQYRPTGGLTPLLYAARSGCVDCIKAILAAGENIDRPTPDGVTALMLAIDNLEFDAAAFLLDAGANPNYADWWGRTALYLAVDMNSYIPRTVLGGLDSQDTIPGATASKDTTAMTLIERLLAAGVEVNTQLNHHRPGRGGNSERFTDDLLTTGATPLLRAAITHDHAVMRLLLAHGARVDLPNAMGVTPLLAAASMGVRNINFGSNRSPLFETDDRIETKVIESLGILLTAGADINARVTDTHSHTARIARISQMTDVEGQTALFAAARHGWANVVRYLVDHGARVDVEDALGQTPLDAALGRTTRSRDVSEDVAGILRAAGA